MHPRVRPREQETPEWGREGTRRALQVHRLKDELPVLAWCRQRLFSLRANSSQMRAPGCGQTDLALLPPGTRRRGKSGS